VKEETLRTLEAFAVLGGAVAAWILVPAETLLPLAFAVLAVAVAGVFGARAVARKIPAEPYDERRELVLEAGMLLGMLGVAAFIILLLEYAD